ncbi:hypothetical protein B296_00050317 [Ensete ventricosum]|uniref:Uncharacterized protein n=1 Tax=Ensete ventricosum TaxID=4639 RepID=A0A426YLT1_ENSVE|nr:hypothetical protein B296_00050317 [Ensete ventricosum]
MGDQHGWYQSVQTAVDSLRATAADRTSNLQKEMSTVHDFTCSVKDQWKIYMDETENHFVEDTAAVESGKHGLEEGVQNWELKSGHYHKIVEITDNTGKCLEEEYVLHVPQQFHQVDVPSCSTPQRRTINLPSVASIEELRTPAFEELLKSFGDAVSASKQANGDVKHFSGSYETQLQSSRDSRVPLTAIN